MVIAHVSAQILSEMRVNFQNLYSAREIIDAYHFVKRFVFFFLCRLLPKIHSPTLLLMKEDEGSLSYS